MVIFKNNEGRNVAFWVFVCVKLLFADEYIVNECKPAVSA